jgi:hypothetical protein
MFELTLGQKNYLKVLQHSINVQNRQVWGFVVAPSEGCAVAA